MRAMRDLILLIGLGALLTGLYQAWPPLAWIVGGGVLCVGTLAWWYMEQRGKHRRQG